MPIDSHNKTGVTPKWPTELFDPNPHLKRETDSVPDERKGQAKSLNALLLEVRQMQEVLGTLPNWSQGETYIDHLLGNMIYGDGSDGDVTISGSTTLSRDMYYNDLTITGTGILSTDGYRVFVRGTLTVQSGGIIENDGAPASTGTGGVGSTAHTLGAGTSGGDATNNGTNATDAIGGAGGDGGNGTTGGTITAPSLLPGLRDVAVATTLNWAGAAFNGGAGGAGGNDANSGAGGAGGGVMMIAAKKIINNGIISCVGGDATDGQSGNGDGGGGGGGGVVVLVTSQALTGTAPDVSGGALGSAVGSGADGVDGAAGLSLIVVL